LAKKLGQETDLYGSQLLIHKLPTTITDATITAIADATIAAAITDAIAAAATARRWGRRRNVDSTAAAATTPTGVVPTATAVRADAVRAATPSAATVATVCRTITIVALCLGVGGNGSSSECEGRCEYGGYPA
jgi:hypothetical protein